jgi:predicted nucleotidyltransferase
MENTKEIAEKIVETLSNELSKIKLSSLKCIYILGSYCRGDWLNNCSDLDIHMIYSEDNNMRQNDLNKIHKIVENINGLKKINSHCPGGIDYGFNEFAYIPKTVEDASKPNPYPYFSALMFDLKKYHKTVYGIELNELLPETPDTKTTTKNWLLVLLERTKVLERGNIKIPFNVYKIILALQLIFGEITINKYKILELYQRNVPEFEMKWFGEMIIRNYIGSIYPERPLIMYEHNMYLDFLTKPPPPKGGGFFSG